MAQAAAFAQALKQRRKALALTQRQLAQQVGCAIGTLQRIEQGTLRPSPQIAHRLAERLDLSPAEREQFVRLARLDLTVQGEASGSHTGAASAVLPLRSRLPVPLTPLLGRAQEVTAVCTRLAAPAVRLVTLVGPAGIGKTRLALQVAAERLPHFADGVSFVDLAPITDPELVLSTIAATLSVKETGGQPLIESLQAHLAAKQVLLVLDNFEQVVAAAPLVADLLHAVSKLKVLVTSRAVLHLSGEHEFPVPPLVLPDPNHLPERATLVQVAAVALFIQRTQAVKPDFQITTANAPAVAEICVRLDGLPLAIELAAARSKLLAPEALLRRLEHRLVVLTGGARDLPARQQTIRATIDWSYHLLDPAEQRLFTRLAVFVGGWTLEAAEAVCDADGDLGLDALDGLQSLVDKSLVRQAPGPEGEPRFGMFETIREYAQERLVASGEAALQQRHTAYFLALAEQAEPALQGLQVRIGQLCRPAGDRGAVPAHPAAQRGPWLARLEQEHDNLRAALKWALAQGAVELGWRLCYALRYFWRRRGYEREARRWIEAVLARPDAGTAAVPVALRAEVLAFVAHAAGAQGDAARERALLEMSLGLGRAAGDPACIGPVLVQLGSPGHDFVQAQARLEEGLAHCRAAGDKRWAAEAVYELGLLARWRGDYAQQRAYTEASLALIREVEDMAERAKVLLDVGERERLRSPDTHGRERAYVLLEESLRLFRELEDQDGSAEALLHLGATLRDQGDYGRARVLLAESVAHFRAMGDKYLLGRALHNLGETLRLQGDDVAARAREEESRDLYQEIGTRLSMAWPLLNLGHIAKHQGDSGQAFAALAESLVLLREVDHHPGIEFCLLGFAGLAARQAAGERAAKLFGAAQALYEAIHADPWPNHRIEMERDIAAARAQLDAATWEAAWAEGRAMTVEQAVAYALAEVPDA